MSVTRLLAISLGAILTNNFIFALCSVRDSCISKAF